MLEKQDRGEIGRNIWAELDNQNLVWLDNSAPVQPLQYKWEFNKLLEVFDQFSPASVLEIGCWRGGSLYQWIKRSSSFMSTAAAVSQDATDQEIEMWYSWAKEFKKIDSLFLKGDSHDPEIIEQIKQFFCEGNELDFLFIDGDHSYEGVKQDFENYGSLVVEDGLIVLQDIIYADRCPEVRVDLLWKEIKEYGYVTQEFYTSPNQGGLGIGIVYV